MNYEKTKKAYADILKVINENKDICVYDVENLDTQANVHLFGIELKEKYGFDIEPCDISSMDYIRMDDYRSIGWWGKEHNRTISWSDDGKQPKDELLLRIGFSTGAYIFGDDYPKEFFQEFFQELKSYNPKYTDTANNDIYFSMNNASKMSNDFPAILKKYQEKNRIDEKRRKVKKLKEEIETLEDKPITE